MLSRSGLKRAAVTAALTATGALLAAPGQALAESAFAIDEANNLYTFDTKTPGTLGAAVPITGLGAGFTAEAIDVRPSTGDLYVLATNVAQDTRRVFTLNTTTGVATANSAAGFALTGAATGFDFNPTVDRIRLATDTDLNRRLAPLNGAVTTDGNINPTADVAGAAYTNNVSGALSTRLYYLDFNGGAARLLFSGDPNAGTVTTVGSLGAVLANPSIGFDVSGTTGIAYASVQATANTATLHRIDLDTGAASAGVAFGAAATDIADIAIATTPANINALQIEKAFVVTGDQMNPTLQTLNTNAPQTLTSVAALTLPSNETFSGLDAQPSTGRLFLLTKDASNNGRIYTVNKATAALTAVTTVPFELDGGVASIDFNPVPNAIRVVTTLGKNFRVSPVTGNLAAGDTALSGTAAQNVADVAYDNNVNGAQQSTLYALDATGDSLKLQGGLGGVPSPNGGVLSDIGAAAPFGTLGIDTSTQVGFDISGGSGIGYATLTPKSGNSRLHRIDLATGRAGTGALIGTGVDVLDIAVDIQPPSVQFSAAAFSADEGAAKATVTITRSGNTDGESTVSYATTATGNATAGTDFTAIPATPVTFAAGETTKTFDITVANDSAVEDNETIGIALSAQTGASLAAPSTGTVTVFDDDPTTTGTTTTVPGPTTTVTGPTVPTVPAAVAARSATAKATPTRDRTKPYRFRISGSVTPPTGLAKSTACRYGTVAIVVKRGTRTITTVERRLTTSCTFSSNVTVTAKGKYKVAVRFLGSDRLKPRAIRTLNVQAG